MNFLIKKESYLADDCIENGEIIPSLAPLSFLDFVASHYSIESFAQRNDEFYKFFVDGKLDDPSVLQMIEAYLEDQKESARIVGKNIIWG